jgi:chromosome segregation ATPase
MLARCAEEMRESRQKARELEQQLKQAQNSSEADLLRLRVQQLESEVSRLNAAEAELDGFKAQSGDIVAIEEERDELAAKVEAITREKDELAAKLDASAGNAGMFLTEKAFRW